VEAVLAIDIGGTKLEAGLVTGDGAVLTTARVPTNVADPWPGLAALVGGVLADAKGSGVRVRAAGVGCGGPMLPGGEEVSPLNITGWRGFALHRHLTELTGLDVTIDNDAKALALGEGWLGAAAGERDYLAMVVSTGVGGGIVLDGRLLHGRLGNAGHIGHLVVVPDGGALCGCGARGCLEAEASGLAIERATGRPPAEAPLDVRERTGRLVGLAVADVAVLLDLELAVVAGSVALGFGEPFFAAAQAELDARCAISYTRGAVLRPGGLGDRGPLLGAAALALQGGASRGRDRRVPDTRSR
jgi:glucokinase